MKLIGSKSPKDNMKTTNLGASKSFVGPKSPKIAEGGVISRVTSNKSTGF
jgi:hypothetical protein